MFSGNDWSCSIKTEGFMLEIFLYIKNKSRIAINGEDTIVSNELSEIFNGNELSIPVPGSKYIIPREPLISVRITILRFKMFKRINVHRFIM